MYVVYLLAIAMIRGENAKKKGVIARRASIGSIERRAIDSARAARRCESTLVNDQTLTIELEPPDLKTGARLCENDDGCE